MLSGLFNDWKVAMNRRSFLSLMCQAPVAFSFANASAKTPVAKPNVIVIL